MEGKAALFKRFAGIDAWPVCLDTQDTDEIVRTVQIIAPALRRHQPGGHRRAALLRGGAPAARPARHPGLPRRPARHRDRGARRADQRAARGRQEAGDGADRHGRRGRRRDGGAQAAARPGCDRRDRLRRPGRGARGPRRPGRQPALGRRAHQRRRVRRATWRARCAARTCSSGCRRRTSSPARTSRRWRRTRSCSRWPTPTPRSTPTRPASTPRWSPPAAATTRTRSTTCWRSPGCSAGCWTRRAGRSPTTCWSPRPARWPAWCPPAELGPHYIIPSVFHPEVASAVAAAVRDAAGGRPSRLPGHALARPPPPISQNGDMEEEESLAGRLLVATPLLGDPNFRRPVVLVVEDEPERGHPRRGAEPADQDAGRAGAGTLDGPGEQAFGGVPGRARRPEQRARPGQRAGAGGTGRLAGAGRIALRPGSAWSTWTPRRSCWPGGIASLRVFAGYAGWGPGQVQAEIEEGAWYVLPAEPADAFAGRAGAALAGGAAPGRGYSCPGGDVSG